MNETRARFNPDGGSLIEDRSLATEVYAAILRAIHNREIRPGDWITETEIATQLGISRSPVREALAQLTNQGLIVRVPRRGSYIATLDQEDIASFRDCRQLIEGYAARSLAERITPEVVEALEDLIDQMVDSARNRDWIQTVYLNSQFHETVVRACGNTVLHRLWASVDPLAWLVAATKEPGHEHDPADLQERHRHLLESLKSGNPDRAEADFRAHVAESLSE